EGPSPLVEVILPATYRGRAVWRVVHRDADPTTPGSAASYDMYDVDRATLVPVRSIMSREGLYLALAFDAGKVTIAPRDERQPARRGHRSGSHARGSRPHHAARLASAARGLPHQLRDRRSLGRGGAREADGSRRRGVGDDPHPARPL